MTTSTGTAKKFASAMMMASAVIAVGLSFGSGTAQASPKSPHPHPHRATTQNSFVQNFIQFTDTRIADPLQSLLGVGEGTPFDDSTDSFHGLM